MSKVLKINDENWTSAYFTSGPLRAFVSMGAAPIIKTEIQEVPEVEIQYLVTLTDNDYQELFQSIHQELNTALLILNEKYEHWELRDALNKGNTEACTSCVAH